MRQLRPRVLFCTATDKLAKLEDHGICDLVIDVQPFASAADQASLAERMEVLGNVGLAGAQHGNDVMDGLFARLQRLQNTQPHGLTQ